MASQTWSQGSPTIVAALSQNKMIQETLGCFRSIQLAIVLLSLMAIATIIGVVFPQEGMTDVAEIQKRYAENYTLYNNLGLFTVFSSFWFITLQVLFFFNLLVGSFKWLKPATLAAIQKYTLPPSLITQKQGCFSPLVVASDNIENTSQKITGLLKKAGYRIFKDTQGNIYGSKANFSRLGPCVAHIGILLCLIAGVYSSFTGFKAVRMAIPGQIFAVPEANTFKTNTPEPYWQGSIPNWRIRVKDFFIEFYPDHPETAKQYYSKIDILSPEDKVLQSATVSVNHPLIYDNVSVYQASFAPTGRFILNVAGKPLTVEVNDQLQNRPVSLSVLEDGSKLIMLPFFAAQDPGIKKNLGIFFITKRGEPVEKEAMVRNLKLEEGESGVLKGIPITYVKPEMSTGLQIKRAPEVTLMYLSYIIIAAGTLMCFFSQRQIWVTLEAVSNGKTALMIYPKTNKAWLSFRQELAQITQQITQSLSPLPARQEH